MNLNDEQIRAAIAEQAGNWLVANGEGLDAQDAEALTTWLKGSPVHIEEFLGVSSIARDLKDARTDPEYSIEAILARAQAQDDDAIQPLRPGIGSVGRVRTLRHWLKVSAAIAACVVLGLGLLLKWNGRPIEHLSTPNGITALHFETRRGEMLDRRLPDNSILHLNTESAVTIRYSKRERLVTLVSGEAAFEVTHEADRAFRVIAGLAQTVDVGTRFDVRIEASSTLVTVVEGRVAVGLSQTLDARDENSSHIRTSQFVQVNAGQQLEVSDGQLPASPKAVDAESATAWLHKEMVFDHEPLEHVVAEMNRYAPKRIEVATPGLRNLQISGVFATDDVDAFIAFLRTFKGVRVDVTATQIRVTGN